MTMKRIPLGNTGLEVSAVGFGGIPITRLGEQVAASLVRRAVDCGINFFDTAYGYPGSEERIGLGIRGLDRASLAIASKDPSADGKMFARHVRESLERLGTEYLDLMQFHNVADREAWDAIRAPKGAYGAALKLRDDGLVRHVGVTSHNVALAAEMIESGEFETVQVPLNFVADEAAPLVARCRERGVGFIGMKPFGGGAIEDGELALQYLQQFPSVAPIPGIETGEELDQVVELAMHPSPLTEAQRGRVDELKKEIGKVFCRACGYCQPCPEEIPIPMMLRAESFARRMPKEKTRRSLERHMPKIERCTECRQCVERCPYELDIPAMLRASRRWYHGWLETLEG